MIYAILILMGFALLHFVYESIILPSIRLNLKYKLFALRDELRLLKHNNNDMVSNEIYMAQEDTINNAVAIIPYIDIYRLATVTVRESGPDLKNKADERLKLINSCRLDEVKNINHRAVQIIFNAFIANIGAIFVLLVPIAVITVYVKKVLALIERILSVPENDLNNIITAHGV